ncbi:hypothetical protein Lokhon_02568 [Limimaricola hongkongensis DSM 17492]|uniref:Uncharacterized protein n=1 Tax=Limimaricola hongkongensis DSM 17492 TaxID=1122180 RepID=A0A017HAW0_9RHOB|nr:hypothetical protein Lokhon_02568 [Limimaricola hongkongensis DSM 17492]
MRKRSHVVLLDMRMGCVPHHAVKESPGPRGDGPRAVTPEK